MYSYQPRREEEIPKQCPYCGKPINQDVGYWSSRIRKNCGSTACRKKASRKTIRERKKEEREDISQRIEQYAAQLPLDQRTAIVKAMNVLMEADYDEGHNIMWHVVRVIEAQRCKHDKIQILIDNAAAAKRRAEKAEEHNRQLEALLQGRIVELEAELHVYQLLENTIHGIATRQLEKQPEPPALPTRTSVGSNPASTSLAPQRSVLRDEEDDESYDEEDEE
jgi:uncharacterized protein YqgV (UPF0045/DUF77 family)